MTTRRAFTLVELLIVVAIVGVLSSIVIASTASTRSKASDTKRISDIKEIQLGLALYYDVNKSYPADLATLTAQRYLPSIPTDPSGLPYEYVTTGTPIVHYCLGATLVGTIPNDSATCSLAPGSTANYKAYR